MLPYTPLHLLLEAFAALSPLGLVMTSGNAGGEPISLGNREALALAAHRRPLLFHNQDILIRADDSVVRVESSPGKCFSTDNNPQHYPQKQHPLPVPPAQTELLRGFLPVSQKPEGWGPGAETFFGKRPPRESPPLHFFEGQEGSFRGRWNSPRRGPLRIGHRRELKNTLCLTRGKDAFLSQHGRLENLETFEFFQNMAEHLGGLLEVKPEAIVCDLHPDYLSTSYALDSGLPVLRLQHHFAHVYGVLAENGHDAPRSG